MRTTLTRSLHTVTAVSRLAIHLHATRSNGPKRSAALVQQALHILGQAGAWAEDDPTFMACIAATHRGIEAWNKQQSVASQIKRTSARAASSAHTAAPTNSRAAASTSAPAAPARK